MKFSINHSIKVLFSFFILLLFGVVFVHAETKTITVTLSNTPTSINVHKAPLKYNKDFAYSYIFDDGYGEWYDIWFKYLNGWKINANNTNYPWLYYTDWAGNDIPFAWWFATTSLSSAWNDLHDWITPWYITYDQFDETYLAWWNVLHHWFGPALWIPPDYLQNILSGTEYFQNHTINNIKLQHFVIPDWLNDYAASVFSGWLKSVSQQNTTFFFDWVNHTVSSSWIPVNNLDINKYAMYRKYFQDSAFTTWTIINDVDEIANASSWEIKLWRQWFSHRVTFNDQMLNGNLSWEKWKYLMDHIADNYGKSWNDSAWIAWPQDVYEYIWTRNNVSIQTWLNNNQFTITIDTNNVDEEYVRKSLSLLLDVQWATITSISYQTWAFTNYSNNNQNWLINLDRWLAYTWNLETKVDDYVSEAEYYKTQYYIDTAQTRIDFLQNWTNKTNFQNRLDTIEIQWTTRQINLWKSANSRWIWNNYKEYNTIPWIFTDLYDKYGNITNLDISLQSWFNNKYAWQTTTPDGDGIYPNDVMDSWLGIYWNALANGTGTVKISWLDISKTYNITLFGSTTNTQTNNRTVTVYNIWSETKELNIRQNTQNTVTFSGVSTSAGWEILIHVAQKDKNRWYWMVNSIVIQETFEEWIITPTATIDYSTTQVTSNNVIATLTWFNTTWITITNNNGSPNYVFTWNGSFIFTFQDSQWVSWSQIATVHWINKALMISGVNPIHTSTNIDIDQDIMIEFRETMNKSSVESNLQISPNPWNKWYQRIWNTLYIMHDDFDNNTEYTVTIWADTMNINWSYLSTNYWFNFTTLAAANNNVRQLDFGYDSFSRWLWNQINIGLINWSSNTDLYDSNWNQTNIYIQAIKRWQDKIVTWAITNNDSGIYADNRIYKWVNTYGKYSTSQWYPEAEMMIWWLNPNKTYNFKFYGNTFRVEADPTLTTTVYSVSWQSVSLQSSQNTNNDVSINNISPSSSWTINFSYKSANETNRTRSYLNVLIIQENWESIDYIPIPNSENSNTIENEFTNWWYTKWAWSLRTVSATTMVWKKRINFENNAGKLLIPTVLKSSNNLIEVSLPEWAILQKSEQWFTGILEIPMFIDKTTITNLANVSAAVRIGDTTNGSILIKDWSNNAMNATLRIPAPETSIGEKVNVYYSEDQWSTWSLHGNYTVTSIGWQSYVEFTTNHFTDFAISNWVGSFTINNDAASTTSQTVTLNISTTPPAVQMRFSDDGTNWPARENYASTKTRTLPGTYGSKTVYAQFDADGDNVSDVETSDTITYSAPWVGGSSQWQLTLEIGHGTWSCQYGTSLNLGAQVAWYSAKIFSWSFASSFRCEDKNGTDDDWVLSIQSSLLTNASNSNYTIPAMNVELQNSPAHIVNGNCAIYTGTTSRTPINSPTSILGKNHDMGAICKIQADTVTLKVTTDINQAVGIYTGEITIDVPNFN